MNKKGNEKKNIIFMGPLYRDDEEKELLNNIEGFVPSIAPNVFQWSLIKGIEKNLDDNIHIVNALPIGTWPTGYKKILLNTYRWENGKSASYEIGCINIPFIKQLTRVWNSRRILSKVIKGKTEIIIYSPYLPFLKAVKRLASSTKVTLIIADLPEYYDLEEVSKIKRMLRKIQNKMIYDSFRCVDRYILLTEQMKERLPINNHPYMVMEGIYNFKENGIYKENRENPINVIFYSGSLRYIYGIKNLLLAFSEIKRNDIQLWICGNGEAEKEIVQLSKQDNRIHFFGFCDQKKVANLRGNASILINPRTNEGEYTKYSFPSKTMEYLASGKPVIMYKLDGIPDEYDSFINYVEGNDYIGLKYKIEEIIDNYDEAKKRAACGQSFIFEKKNSVTQGKRLLNFMENNRNN